MIGSETLDEIDYVLHFRNRVGDHDSGFPA
jgi:hypothetical protein